MESPVIFLDVDGPLLPARYRYSKHNQQVFLESGLKGILKNPEFDPIAIEFFRLWIDYSGAKVVFSTNWMYHMDKDDLLKILLDNGLKNIQLHDDPVTPKRFTSHRGREVSGWLADHPEVTTYLAVDDDIDIQMSLDKDRYTFVDYYNGLTIQNFLEGCKILGIDVRGVHSDILGTKIPSKESSISLDQAVHSFF